jgi:DNA-binding MarR family transcriptional regulator
MTPTQQRIMIFLASVVDARSREITAALQIDPSTLTRVLPELYEQDFVRKTKIGSMHVVRYSLTEDGLSVANRLIRYQATDGQIVQPARINKMEGEYKPKPSYQRNQGHKELESRGYQC